MTGTLMRDGKPVSSFEADSGTADRSSGVITLQGNVKVTSLDESSHFAGATLTCDNVRYATSDEIVKASGSVSFKDQATEVATFPQIWCSSDLSRIASPEMYEHLRHNQPSPASRNP